MRIAAWASGGCTRFVEGIGIVGHPSPLEDTLKI